MIDTKGLNDRYSIDEVSRQCGVASYILRYWEMHFDELRDPSGQSKAFYTPHDVAIIWRIKKFLYLDLLTLDEAKKRLTQERLFPVQDRGFSITGRTEAEKQVHETPQEVTSVEPELPQNEAKVEASPVEVKAKEPSSMDDASVATVAPEAKKPSFLDAIAELKKLREQLPQK